MIRDWWTCTIVSVMFEFLEYSLEHQLPNFSECWWDHVGAGTPPVHGGAGAAGSIPGPRPAHPALGEGRGAGSPQTRWPGLRVRGACRPPQWIMDVLVCNGLGIYCGMKTLEWLSLKTYKWQGLWNIPTYKYVCRACCCAGSGCGVGPGDNRRCRPSSVTDSAS